MKSVAAVATAFAILLVAWLLVGTVFFLLGWLVSEARPSSSGILTLHTILMWTVTPGAAAYLAILITAQRFPSVPIATIHVGFISALTVILLLLLVMGVVRFSAGHDPPGQLVMFIAQATALYIGAGIGKRVGHSRRGALES